MTVKRGIGFPIKRDFILKKGMNLYFVTDEQKTWFEADNTQLTYPKNYFKVSNDSRLWLVKNKPIPK